MRARLPIVVLTAMFTIAAVGITAQESEVPALFRVVAEGDDSGIAARRTAVLGARQVRVHSNTLLRSTTPGTRLALDLAPDVSVVAEFHTIRDDEFNGQVWSGAVVGHEFSSAHFVYERGIVVGTVSFDGRGFDVRPRGNGRAVIVEYDPARVPTGDDAVLPATSVANARAAVDPQPLAKDVTIDVLGLYMPEAAKEVGGTKVMKADWKLTVAVMNAALDASGLGITVRLVKLKKMKYKGPIDNRGPGGGALSALQKDEDGFMDKAHKFRAKFGADIVSLAIAFTEGICGLGYLLGNNNGVTAAQSIWAFNVVRSDCVGGYGAFTFAHECGHKMGLRHNKEDASTTVWGGYPSSFGHRVPGSYRTIMSYVCSADGLASCPRAGYFSNPKKKHMGSKTGVKKKADNALSLKKDANTVANWTKCRKACG